MEHITRRQARKQGLPRYFTGKPCKHGHIAERRISDGGRCIECHKVLQSKSLRRWRKQDPIKYLLKGAKERCVSSGLEFNITAEDLGPIPATCPVLGIPLEVGTYATRDSSPSLDRVDSSKGYIPGNVFIVSWRANALKKNATLQELKQIVTYMEKHQ